MGVPLPVDIQVADNFSIKVRSILNSSLRRADEVKIAVAFVSRGGLELIESAVNESLGRCAYLEFLVGLDMRVTEPEAMRYLFDLSQETDQFKIYCLVSAGQTELYHPKVYLLKSGVEVTCIVGSSNLTRGGLSNNVEVNLVLRASADSEIVSDIYATYNRLKCHPRRVIPDEELLDLYSALCKFESRYRQEIHSSSRSRGLLKKFDEKAKSLRRPQVTVRDLVGWSRLVYDTLPDGEFSNQQVYESEALLKSYYPDNQNVRAKIRQQLQILRDVGLLEHMGRARWRKLQRNLH